MKPTFERTWRGKSVCDGARTIDGMIRKLHLAIGELEEMRDRGVVLDGKVEDDYGFLVTGDRKIASYFGGFMEREFPKTQAGKEKRAPRR